jgi:hypothetical protein
MAQAGFLTGAAPTSRRTPIPLIDELIQILGQAHVLVEREDLIPYSFDATAP